MTRSPQALRYRQEVYPEDADTVHRIVISSGFFSAAEADIAVELVQERLARGESLSGYAFWFAEDATGVVGYTCFGPIPGTLYSYDLYWIAVQQTLRARGIGRQLLQRTEETIAQRSGQRIYVETSSRPLYAPTHAFYQSHAYRQQAFLSDYYAPGDAKIIYMKSLEKGTSIPYG